MLDYGLRVENKIEPYPPSITYFQHSTQRNVASEVADDIETENCMTGQTFHSNHPDETRQIGEIVGRALTTGDVVALIGGLGTGKTCLTQGIARGIGLHAGKGTKACDQCPIRWSHTG